LLQGLCFSFQKGGRSPPLPYDLLLQLLIFFSKRRAQPALAIRPTAPAFAFPFKKAGAARPCLSTSEVSGANEQAQVPFMKLLANIL
jgi:hypothetical protein